MSEGDRNLPANCSHARGEQQTERRIKYTPCLVASVLVCVFGNSFAHGYNIGVVNSPASIIKLFYTKVNLAKKGYVTEFKDGRLYYVDPEGNSDAFIGETVLDTTSNASRADVALPDEDLMDWWWSVTVAIFVLFGMFGAFVSGKIADGYGRKRGMLIVSTVLILSALLGFIAKLDGIMSPVLVIVSRAFAGLQCGINVSLAPVYLAEIAPQKIRGAVGTVHQLFITLGLLWSMVMGLPELAGSWESWNLLFAFNALPAGVFLLIFPFCPESPRYLLIKKNKEKKAASALKKLRGYEDVDDEIDEMKIEAMKAPTKFSRFQLFRSPELRLPLVIAVVLQAAQQWSGINAVMSYSSFIFRQASIPDDSIPYVIVGQGIVNVLATIVAVPLLEKVGRRPLLFWPMIVMALSFIAFVICLLVLKEQETGIANNGLAITCIILMVPYVVGFAVGLGPLPYVVVTEIFRQGPRAAAMGFAQAINWICNLVLMWTFIFIQKNVQEYVYIIFASIIIGSVMFFYFCLPETKDRTFDDIADSVAYWRRKRTNGVEEIVEESLPINIGNTENISEGSASSTSMNRETVV